MSNSSAIFAVIKAIPAGRVATYGQVARLAGLPGAARLVGHTLRKLPENSQLPWHRIINAQGRIALPEDSPGYSEQIARLRDEQIEVVGGRVSLSRYRWRPEQL
ncbi:cysteine methyltransferase [Saccharophagus sp. K07]|jgi:methylated-DNA-protein-cysteine methyltransferase-like protein|uniref:MGMT family protein n=1 Tax=Saccharophagus sp. K07 TaxID=2283636 RepID=UPI001651FD11|nr:MGMT family protein [Saccharophagus sp. K07]MBC6905571.1 cysteine methyltransferase [Saccharophagus sp. K07]